MNKFERVSAINVSSSRFAYFWFKRQYSCYTPNSNIFDISIFKYINNSKVDFMKQILISSIQKYRFKNQYILINLKKTYYLIVKVKDQKLNINPQLESLSIMSH